MVAEGRPCVLFGCAAGYRTGVSMCGRQAGGVSFGLSDNLDLAPARAERLQLLLDRAWMKGAGLDMSAVRLLSLSPPCWRCWGQSLWQCRGHETVAGRTLAEAGEMPAS